MVKESVVLVLGVSYIESAILLIICVNLLFSVWQTRILGMAIRIEAKKLDHNIAEALPIVLTNAVSELNLSDLPEPPNPLMQIIAEAIGNQMKPPSLDVKEIIRSEDGQFSKP